MSASAQASTEHEKLADGLMHKTRASYVAALILIASLATASFFMLSSVISANTQKTALIELGARQQMLSQRILLSATEAHTANVQWLRTQARQNLKAALDNFLANERILRNGSPDTRSPLHRLELSEDATRLFTEAPGQIDATTRILEYTVNSYLKLLPDSVSAEMPADATAHFAALRLYVAEKARREYETLTRLFSSEAAEKGAAVEKIHLTVFVLTLLLLVAEAVLIFRPLVRRVVSCTSELLRARDQMNFAANHDALTGLYNRAFLNDYMDTALAAARRKGETVAVIHIDLDHFKTVNDTLGHAAGDAVLIETARRLVASVRESDVCVRLGGDEFTVILTDVGTEADAVEVATRITTSIKQPLEFAGASLKPSASAGVALFHDATATMDELFVNADLALYRAKAEGRGGYRLFAATLRDKFEERANLERELREAIAAEAFAVHFQPQVSLQTGKVIGVEALVRWEARGRSVSPGEFLPAAEKAGLMPAIGRSIFAKAIRTAAGWHRTGLDFGRLSLNVSAQELHEADFANHLLGLLKAEGLPTRLVALEIVESVMLDDENSGIGLTLKRLRKAGIRMELDDFGTGYASLSHISANEVDRLKIDRRFIRDIHKNPANSKIVKAIIELARGLGISIIAEGAETEKELSFLQALGCPAVQGYGVAFPMPDAQAEAWLAMRNASPQPVVVARTA
ncbi:putative bifunctional diguanylate cyclase/phosphodiesterase [Aminobacter aganoensis]|uniref:Diguanylate cyclase (GGDEF)-like protein n=1 Tax=Aminobacter aganoensis TaxID=83264 RepID=A0A7X0FAU0_9HYPH|nr:EAL domain-containing protein [Aminobacter aganoensis]MBB6356313.1 diguanylate cyclase (GGDEF)-like protein [Aminobacter aganoensis]